ncbi:OmpA family protein [Vibrio sp. WXL210]|uniref:OmpA family protein n=1 Tax=Vibrio sp. WXL210 TaxID=3450709 RepID=UPI003EC92034
MTDVVCRSVYLMGRLFNSQGKPVGKYYPLPNQLLRIASSAVQDCAVTIDNKQNTVKHGHQLYVTSGSGQLEQCDHAVDSEVLKPGVGCNRVLMSAEETAKVMMLPSELLPVAQQTFDSDWLSQLEQQLKDDFKTNLTSLPLSSLSLPEELNQLVSPDELGGDKDDIASYCDWYQRYESLGKSEQILVCTVPQFIAIVVTFSSRVYREASVKISGLPEGMRVVGSNPDNKIVASENGSASARVMEFVYDTFDADENFQSTDDRETSNGFAATFLIESDLPFELGDSQQYCRIDVDLDPAYNKNDDAGYSKDYFNQHNMDMKYSLTEKVLHFPLVTACGRFSVINGDPICLEEVLISHAPNFHNSLLRQIRSAPLADIESSNQPPEELLHELRTVKGNVTSVLSVGKSAQSLDLLGLATAGAFSVGELARSSQKETVQGILNLTRDGEKLFKLINTLVQKTADKKKNQTPEEKKDLLIEAINTWDKALNLDDVTKQALSSRANQTINYLLPKPMQRFVQGTGKALRTMNPAMQKALTAVEFVQQGGKWAKARDTDTDNQQQFNEQVKSYSDAVKTMQLELMEADDAVLQTCTATEQEANQKLQQRLANYSSDLVSIEQSACGDNHLVQIHIGFEFDRGEIAVKDTDTFNEFLKDIAGVLLAQQNPIEVEITGHTCDIGSLSYNDQLSQSRADFVRDGLLEVLGQHDDSRWQHAIRAQGVGSIPPKFLTRSTQADNPEKHRAVVLRFLLSEYELFPASRSAIKQLEASRKKAVAGRVAENQEFVDLVEKAFDVALLGAAALTPLGVAGQMIAAGASHIGDAKDRVSSLANLDKLDTRPDHMNKSLAKLAEADLAQQSMMLEGHEYFDAVGEMKNGYLKRSLALNGLIRLLHHYQLATTSKPASTGTGYWSGGVREYIHELNSKSTFEDYDIPGYIRNFLLSDDWDIHQRIGMFHLDEFWLETKQQASLASYNRLTANNIIAGVRNVTARYLQPENAKRQLKEGEAFSRQFPIHYSGSVDGDYFRSLDIGMNPEFTSSVFKATSMLARPRGRFSDNDWQPFEEYYNKAGRRLSPYDQVRITVILDEQELLDAYNKHRSPERQLKSLDELDYPMAIPVAATPMRNDSGLSFAYVGPETREYVVRTKISDLLEIEQEYFKQQQCFAEGQTHCYAAVIVPSFTFGKNIINGTRPMGKLSEDGSFFEALKEQFGGLMEEPQSVKAAMNARISMTYYYQLSIPGSSKADYHVSYRHSDKYKNTRFDNSLLRSWFYLSLDPEREYKLPGEKKSRKDDAYFFEKSFFEGRNGVEIESPLTFANPKIEVWYTNHSAIQVPDFKNFPYVTPGKRSRFDWGKPTELIALVSADARSTVKHKEQEVSADEFDLDVSMLMGADEISSEHKASGVKLYRVGKLKPNANGEAVFELGDIEDKETLQFVEQVLVPQSGGMLATLMTKTFYGKKKETDLFIARKKLDYVNAVGKKIEGLRPVTLPDAMRMRRAPDYNPPYNLTLQFDALKGSGLDKEQSQTIQLSRIDKASPIPSVWFQADDDNIRIALKQLVTGQRVERKTHDYTSLMRWLEAGDNDISALKEQEIDELDLEVFKPTSFEQLTKKQEKLLADWITK